MKAGYLIVNHIGIYCMTCYITIGKTFIISGRQLLSINRYYDKKIAYYQSIAYAQQSVSENRYPKDTKRIQKLYEKRKKQISHLLHAATKRVVELAEKEGVTKIIIGDITYIRENRDMGHISNQKFHKWPFKLLNADCVGAYNIMKKYLQRIGRPITAVVGLDTPVAYRWDFHQGFIGSTKLANSLAM